MVEQLLLTHEPELRSYCRMLTGTPWDADDLVQETLLKALKAEAKLLGHPSPRALLFRIASNAWIDECRRRKADIGLPDGYEAEAADFTVYSFEIQECIEYLAAAVPPYQAAVILLADVFDYTSREIADMLMTTEGAAKAALHRARKRLAASARQEAQRRSEASPPDFLQQFLEAFRLREPMKIADAYRRLARIGIRTERLTLSGRLHIAFYDPEGNAFTVIAE